INVHIERKFAIINAIIALIHKNEDLADRNSQDFTPLVKASITTVPRQRPEAHPNAHGDGPYDWIKPAALTGDNSAGEASLNAGNSIAAKIAMIAMTTSSSIKVNAEPGRRSGLAAATRGLARFIRFEFSSFL